MSARDEILRRVRAVRPAEPVVVPRDYEMARDLDGLVELLVDRLVDYKATVRRCPGDGLAGTLVAPKIFVDPNMMVGILIYAFAAATLGGFDSPLGAVVGGLIVGVAESLAAGYIDWVGSDFNLGVAFVLILGVLLVRPSGLFGSKEVSRV